MSMKVKTFAILLGIHLDSNLPQLSAPRLRVVQARLRAILLIAVGCNSILLFRIVAVIHQVHSARRCVRHIAALLRVLVVEETEGTKLRVGAQRCWKQGRR